MPRMRGSDIPAFVRELLDAGIEVWALTADKWGIHDADADDNVRWKVAEICDRYGEYEHLHRQIGAYLIWIGRVSPYIHDD